MLTTMRPPRTQLTRVLLVKFSLSRTKPNGKSLIITTMADSRQPSHLSLDLGHPVSDSGHWSGLRYPVLGLVVRHPQAVGRGGCLRVRLNIVIKK